MASYDVASIICQPLICGIFVCSGFGAAVLFGLPPASLMGRAAPKIPIFQDFVVALKPLKSIL